MTIDKPEHREILLELIDVASFKGVNIDAVVELRNAIRDAKIERKKK